MLSSFYEVDLKSVTLIPLAQFSRRQKRKCLEHELRPRSHGPLTLLSLWQFSLSFIPIGNRKMDTARFNTDTGKRRSNELPLLSADGFVSHLVFDAFCPFMREMKPLMMEKILVMPLFDFDGGIGYDDGFGAMPDIILTGLLVNGQ